MEGRARGHHVVDEDDGFFDLSGSSHAVFAGVESWETLLSSSMGRFDGVFAREGIHHVAVGDASQGVCQFAVCAGIALGRGDGHEGCASRDMGFHHGDGFSYGPGFGAFERVGDVSDVLFSRRQVSLPGGDILYDTLVPGHRLWWAIEGVLVWSRVGHGPSYLRESHRSWGRGVFCA